MRINALLIDDEVKPRKLLRMKLEQHCPMINILGEAGDVDEAFDLIQKTSPALIFLDISMPGGTGFNLLEKFNERSFDVIFVTGFDEYAIQAFKVSAVDYLLKPISTEDLIKAVNRAVTNKSEKDKARKFDLLKHNLNHFGDQSTKIAIPGFGGQEFVVVSDIIRCEGWQKYTRLHLISGEKIISSYSIGKFRDLLGPYSFFTCHKSHLINTQHIKKYLKKGIVVMSDLDEVPVSRRRKDQFQEEVISTLNL